MENLKLEDIVEPEVSTSETQTELEQDPLKTELEKVRGGRTEEEKAAFTFTKQAERLSALGMDPLKVLGVTKTEAVQSEDNEDDKPITVGMWKKMQQESGTKSAVDLANDIENESERELVKHYLENTIRPTGNPQEDLKLARSLVNAVKNTQVIEEISRKPVAKAYSSNGGASTRIEKEVELTAEEKQFMSAFKLTKEEILAARPK